MLEVRYGLGRHKYFINEDHYTYFLRYNWLDWNQVIITLAFCKLSICFFLLRISKFDKWRRFLYGVIAFLVLSHLPLELLFLLQCLPIDKNWHQSKPGHCFSKIQVEDIIIVQGGRCSPPCYSYLVPVGMVCMSHYGSRKLTSLNSLFDRLRHCSRSISRTFALSHATPPSAKNHVELAFGFGSCHGIGVYCADSILL